MAAGVAGSGPGASEHKASLNLPLPLAGPNTTVPPTTTPHTGEAPASFFFRPHSFGEETLIVSEFFALHYANRDGEVMLCQGELPF